MNSIYRPSKTSEHTCVAIEFEKIAAENVESVNIGPSLQPVILWNILYFCTKMCTYNEMKLIIHSSIYLFIQVQTRDEDEKQKKPKQPDTLLNIRIFFTAIERYSLSFFIQPTTTSRFTPGDVSIW